MLITSAPYLALYVHFSSDHIFKILDLTITKGYYLLRSQGKFVIVAHIDLTGQLLKVMDRICKIGLNPIGTGVLGMIW